MHLSTTFVALLASALFTSTTLGSAIPASNALEARTDAAFRSPASFTKRNLRLRDDDDDDDDDDEEDEHPEKLIEALCGCKGAACNKIRAELVARGHTDVGIDDTKTGKDQDTLKTKYMMTCIGVAIVGQKSDKSPGDAQTRMLSHIFGHKAGAEKQIKKLEDALDKAKLKDIKWVMTVPDLDLDDKSKVPDSPTGMPKFGKSHVDAIKPAIELVEDKIKDATDERPKEIVKRNMRNMQPTVKAPFGEIEINAGGDILVEGKKVA